MSNKIIYILALILIIQTVYGLYNPWEWADYFIDINTNKDVVFIYESGIKTKHGEFDVLTMFPQKYSADLEFPDIFYSSVDFSKMYEDLYIENCDVKLYYNDGKETKEIKWYKIKVEPRGGDKFYESFKDIEREYLTYEPERGFKRILFFFSEEVPKKIKRVKYKVMVEFRLKGKDSELIRIEKEYELKRKFILQLKTPT